MDFLSKIMARKAEETLRLFETGVMAGFQAAIAARRAPLSLKQALDSRPGTAIIAEVKRASPSKGALGMDWDPVELALIYQENGAAAISVLTERDYFHGDPEFIRRMRPRINIPLLRKDFILEPIQVYETAALGADALLLIVRLLQFGQLQALLLLTHSLGLEALVEVHTREELAQALAAGARLIGVNHRDLGTFEMHMERALELKPLVPPEVTLVAASGLNTRADLQRLEKGGIRAFLIGESLVTQGNPGEKLQELLGPEKPHR